MQGKHLYEYAVIRFVPRVEREEFINVGIILFSKRTKFIKARYLVDEKKTALFSSELDLDSLYASLRVFDHICSGSKEGGAIAALDISEPFPVADGSEEFVFANFPSASGFFVGPRSHFRATVYRTGFMKENC